MRIIFHPSFVIFHFSFLLFFRNFAPLLQNKLLENYEKSEPYPLRGFNRHEDVEGKKIARQQADDIHRIIFKDVQLSESDNKIQVKAGKLSDECLWTLSEK
ncbi:MAG: hypothetical protein IJ841_03835 [Prevotella sp.]|nr:hypothetical protein [Prevotella sp.]